MAKLTIGYEDLATLSDAEILSLLESGGSIRFVHRMVSHALRYREGETEPWLLSTLHVSEQIELRTANLLMLMSRMFADVRKDTTWEEAQYEVDIEVERD